MPFEIVRNDITKMKVDAIVNAANETLLGGGGVDGCIHRAAGLGLLAECASLHGCRTGSAKVTGGYRLPCRWIIHAVGPIWHGGSRGEAELLASCYRTALCLADEKGCESIAFPLISAGGYHYPREQALEIATREIAAFLQQHEMQVYLVVFDKGSFAIGEALQRDIRQYIDDHYVETQHRADRRGGLVDSCISAQPSAQPRPHSPMPKAAREAELFSRTEGAHIPAAPLSPPDAANAPAAPSLDERLRQLDESFSQMLLRRIDEKGMKDAACYRRANVDRKLFSKIRSNPDYRPSKQTAMAFAVALELPMDEARELLQKAGFAFSRANKFDVIVSYFIENGRYDIYEINQTLFAFDQSLLGG